MSDPVVTSISTSTSTASAEDPRPRRLWIRVVIIVAAVLMGVLAYVVVTQALDALNTVAEKGKTPQTAEEGGPVVSESADLVSSFAFHD
jgi:hypothetical protein